MRRRFHLPLGILTCILVSTAVSAVEAQAWLGDRSRAEGHGIRLGDFELHPGIGSEVGYFSNVFNSDQPEATGALRIAPHLYLSTLGEERREGASDGGRGLGVVAFRGGIAGSLLHYFETTAPLSIGADVNLELVINPERPFSFAIIESFQRTYRPVDTSLAGRNQSADFGRNIQNIGGKFMLASPGGLLKADLGYRFTWDFFDDASWNNQENMSHSVELGSSWEFLPKTALFYDAAYTFQDYVNNDPASATNYTQLQNNHRVSTMIGLNGAISSRIAATVSVGYAAGFFAGNSDDLEGLTTSVEGRWVPAETSELALRYDRAFAPAFQGNFTETNRIALRARAMFGGAFLLSAQTGIEFISFGFDPQQNQDRDDRRYFGDLSGEYRFVDWLAMTAQAGIVVDDTDFVFVDPNDPANTDPAKYTSFEGWIGLRAFY